MKYTEVPLFKEGMPSWLYEMKEEDRLKLDFEISKDGRMIYIIGKHGFPSIIPII